MEEMLPFYGMDLRDTWQIGWRKENLKAYDIIEWGLLYFYM
jgi:ribosome modulation factor